MRGWEQVGSIVAISILAAACTEDDGHRHGDPVDCTKYTNTDEFVVGLQKSGASGLIDFQLMSAEPAPPARLDNTWVVQISALEAGVVGAPIDAATITAVPIMPDPTPHTSPIRVAVTPTGQPGQYTLSPVHMFMPGVWETTIRATSGETTDFAVYRFCIN